MPLKRSPCLDLPLYDVLKSWPEMAPVFFRHRMVCVGCMVSRFHTVRDACKAYDMDLDVFHAELVQALRSGRKRPTR